MKQTNKQLKRQRKREFKKFKKENKENLRQEIKTFLDQKELKLENNEENQKNLELIWQQVKDLDKMNLKTLETLKEELIK